MIAHCDGPAGTNVCNGLRLRLVLFGAAALLVAGPAQAQSSGVPREGPRDIPGIDWTARPHGPDYPVTAPPMDETVRTRIAPQMERLLQQLLRERRDTTLGGVRIFASGDKFLPGKIAMAMAYRISLLPPDDPRRAQALKDFADIAALTIDDANEDWGQYYYLSALHSLKEQGVLERAVPPALLARLRARLDWRSFVRTGDLTLIDKPNNYYGVAFAIARLRYLLGWEDVSASDALLARTLDHYRRYSGTYGFADETDGDGRFDRYSVLLIGEIAQRMVETGVAPGAEVKAWLRRSVDLLLPRFNSHGEGFEYGRSIGAYGETLFLEVLTAAAKLKLLSPQEERMAYALSCRISARYADFWTNPRTGSVDLWTQGRRTDAYRGIHRIFGENLSLIRQHLYTDAIWNELGYRGRAPDPGFAAWLDTLPQQTTTWFARGRYDRGVVTIRDRGRVIGLPIVNGADPQHMHNPYFPVPMSPGMLQGSADGGFPQLIPKVTLGDGAVLMPLAYFRDVTVTRRGRVTEVSWRQDTVDRLGARSPIADRRLTVVTRYRFSPGRIERHDQLVPGAGVTIGRIDLEFASFSSLPTASPDGTVRFGRGEVRAFTARGYGACRASAPDDPAYAAPTGPFASLVRCGVEGARSPSGASAKSLDWSLTYQPQAEGAPEAGH